MVGTFEVNSQYFSKYSKKQKTDEEKTNIFTQN